MNKFKMNNYDENKKYKNKFNDCKINNLNYKK